VVLIAVFRKIVVLPSVAMALLGLAFNVVFRVALHFSSLSDVSSVLSDTLSLASAPFAPCALISLGASMVGKLRLVKGKSILRPLLLVLIKNIVTPILCRYFVVFMFRGTVEEVRGQPDGDV
jgi:hypothetical protein